MSDSNTPPLRLQVPEPQNLIKLYGTATRRSQLRHATEPAPPKIEAGSDSNPSWLHPLPFARGIKSNNSSSKRDIVGTAVLALLRGDVGYGNDATMCEAEARGIPYLFKIKRSRNIQKLFRILSGSRGWKDCGSGWEALEQRVKLDGWQRRRRVLFMRRPAEKKVETFEPKKTGRKPRVPKKSTALVPTAPAVVKQAEFDFVKDVKGREWDYCVLGTNDEKTRWYVVLRCAFRKLLMPEQPLGAVIPIQ